MTKKLVHDVYDVLNLAVLAGIEDLTDGIYNNNDSVPYADAQNKQLEYLLDEVACKNNSRILDIGCGNGTLLDHARARGATVVGITLSSEQARWCRQKGHDVCVLDYRNIDESWNNSFDAIVANGSLEHFAQVQDATIDRGSSIYREFFSICHRLLKTPGKLATTAIHFRTTINPKTLLCNPFTLKLWSPNFHYSVLSHTLAGWYPTEGQLANCAEPYFNLLKEVDGADDYRRTSEYWLHEWKRQPFVSPRIGVALIEKFFQQPWVTSKFLFCMIISQSWNWQFRGDPAPTKLFSHTWIKAF